MKSRGLNRPGDSGDWSVPASVESGDWNPGHATREEWCVGRRGYPPEFRRRVLDLVEFGRRVVDVARDLGIGPESIYTWRRQDRIDKGLEPGLTSAERSELAAAKRRIVELQAELAVHSWASELLGKVVPQRGDTRPSR
jgi:transposase